MSKRFIDDGIFQDEWFLDLPNKYKLLWLYIITNCNHWGIIKVSYKQINFYIGENLEPSEIKRILLNRIVEIEGGRKWFIPKFLLFQYPKGLKSKKPAIVSVRDNLLKEKELTIITESLPNDYLIIKDMDMDMDMDKDMNMDKVKNEENNSKDMLTTITRKIHYNAFKVEPNLYELELCVAYVNEFGIENFEKLLIEATTNRSFKKIRSVLRNIDEKGILIPIKYGDKNNESNKRQSPRGTIDFGKYERELRIAKGEEPDVVPDRRTKLLE